MTESLSATWSSQQWRTAAETWAVETLAQHGVAVTGAIEQPRVRFWSTQLTLETERGRWWFKANNPGQGFEPSLVTTLADLVPDHVVTPVYVDRGRAWMLTPDQGPTIHAAGASDRRTWARVVAEYADLQRRVSTALPTLAEAGVPVLRPGEVSERLDAVVTEHAAREPDDPRHVPSDVAAKVRAALPDIEARAGRLESGPIPLSLEHNDLHDNNTFVPQGAGQPLRFFDFGDALVAHPFTSMGLPIATMSEQWDAGRDSAEIGYVVDAYLEPWSDLADRTTLLGLLDDALPFADAHRLATWARVMPYADAGELETFGPAIPGFLTRVSEVFGGPGAD